MFGPVTPPVSTEAESGAGCVLIVEDDAHSLELTASFVREAGGTTVTTGTVVDAFRLVDLLGDRLALVVTDIKLGNESGLDLFRHVRAIRPDLPVVLVTAFGNTDEAVAAMKEGAFYYFTKPVDFPLTEAFNTMAAALGRLASVVAHEVRNPLNAIRGCVDYPRLKRPDDELVGHYAEIIAVEIEAPDAFVGDFLQFTRLQPPRLTAVGVADLLRSRIALHEAEAQSRSVGLELAVDAGVREIRGDSQQLARVFDNLARNAFDAMPGGGSLRITVSQAEDRVEISFADTGVGISDSVAGALFTAFITTKPNGTGLGLPICRRIMELHGGAISFANRVGEGATFRLTPPASSGE